MTIPPDEYPRLLKRALEGEKLPAPQSAPAPAKELPVAEMERLLLAGVSVGPEDLRDLAERRAVTAKELLGKAGVAGERMFIVAVTDVSNGEGKRGPRVDFTLK
jgi:hypothetical protein